MTTMKRTLALATLLTSAFVATPAAAEMLWTNTSLSYLKGDDYKFTPTGNMDVVTLENATGHNWGDTFLFIDRTMPEDGKSSYYGEFSPRLSLGYVTGSDLSFGPVKDLFLTGTWEAGDGFDNYLYGVSVSLDVPGFRYFNASVYKAYNDLADNDEQLTLTWAYPIEAGSQEFLIDGFLDWSTSSKTNESEMNFTPQIKWNAGKNLGLKSPLYVGIEYAYWNNKYGSTTDERCASLLLKWHF
ncbi:Nucleoside-specific outer membrane channel protein Tsx [Amphritea atlantica]|uniref:Nucleoside-specific outer membrane channel protein Tsx n=2 Tax=Amphritea atlantica TaxID=355243 RepID=A0A1H9M5H6_9GAMM|nr:Nucleoside-specific outer membrane channel protein Tsx [Amphritea atlantica]